MLILCLLVIFVLGSTRDDHKHRHQKRHNQHSIHQHGPSSAMHSYGLKLPCFTYDYSELIIGALIERSSDSDDLFLVMFILNHQVIFHHDIIKAFSTDDITLNSWSRAIKVWNQSSSSLDYDRHQNIMCILHNNDPKFGQSYHSQAFWMKSSEESISQSKYGIGSYIDILKCRLKGTSSIYTALSHSNSSLHVDIYHKQSHSSKINLKSQGKLSNHSKFDNNHKSSVDPTSLLLSYSLPWKKRYIGYGFSLFDNLSSFDPWLPFHEASIDDKSFPDSYINKSALCLGLLQPLHLTRSNIPLPMLMESIEHHLSLGFQHIYIGVLVDISSKYIHRYIAALSNFIHLRGKKLEDSVDSQSIVGRISIISLSNSGYDNVGGFDGIIINNEVIENLFYNQCLYFSKGIFDFVTFLEPNEFIFPVVRGVNLQSTINSQMSIDERHSKNLHHQRSSNCNKGNHNNIVVQHNNNNEVHDIVRMLSYGVLDPSDSFGAWGPGESTWGRGLLFDDYFYIVT